MSEAANEKEVDLNELAQAAGLRFPVKVSAELSDLLTPNTFLRGLGISYTERIKTILEIIRGGMVSRKGAMVIPLTIVQGPFIREELVSLRAELAEDDGADEIRLTLIPAHQ